MVLNAWSSSLKFSVFNKNEEEEIFAGIVKRIWNEKWELEYKISWEKKTISQNNKDHSEALEKVVEILFGEKIISNISEVESVW